MKIKKPEKLRDLGEDRILKELIVPKFPKQRRILLGIGDDCAAFLPKKNGHVIVTTIDPCPTPVATMIGGKDYYQFGWFTVVINVSDLAAMGAEPIGLLVSTVMPEEMPIVEYNRFLNGLADAAKKFACPIIGGNIKDGKEFTATGSAFGSVDPLLMMHRKGASPGDLVCVVGEMGIFWAAVIAKLKRIRVDRKKKSVLNQYLYQPMPKILEGIQLAKRKVLTSCMDSSDGITSCLDCLARVNEIDIALNLDLLHPHPAVMEISNKAGVDYKKLMLSWGNWELVGTISPLKVHLASKTIKSAGSTFTVIGEVVKGNGKVWALDKGKRGVLSDLGSHRFSSTSFFSHGIQAYLDHLMRVPISSMGG